MDSLFSLTRFHLKYCERCGGLWLRPDGADDAYCPACARCMAELPRRLLRNQHQAKLPRLAGAIVSLLVLAAHCPTDLVLGRCI